MTGKAPDPLAEMLAQLAANAAPLLRRAMEGGRFSAPHETREPAEPASPASGASADLGALQQVILSQARRIAELEAELAALKAAPKPGRRKVSPSGK
jgi:hypothetical protein